MQDPDEVCRYMAFGVVRDLDPGTFEAVLQSEDKGGALAGLALNSSLSVADLERVRDRLHELGVDRWAEAYFTIKKVQQSQKPQKPRVPEDPEELFGYESREGDFLEDKIDFIGKRLLSFEEEVTEHLRTSQELRTKDRFELVVAIAVVTAFLMWLFK